MMRKIRLFISSVPGYIERMGTGTTDMIQKSVEAGLAEPLFLQEDDFRSVVYRPGSNHVKEQVTMQDTMQVTQESNEEESDEIRNKFG